MHATLLVLAAALAAGLLWWLCGRLQKRSESSFEAVYQETDSTGEACSVPVPSQPELECVVKNTFIEMVPCKSPLGRARCRQRSAPPASPTPSSPRHAADAAGGEGVKGSASAAGADAAAGETGSAVLQEDTLKADQDAASAGDEDALPVQPAEFLPHAEGASGKCPHSVTCSGYIQAGQWVRVVGLQRSPEFNGQCGYVESFDDVQQRYGVRLMLPGRDATNQVLAKLRRENLLLQQALETPLQSRRAPWSLPLLGQPLHGPGPAAEFEDSMVPDTWVSSEREARERQVHAELKVAASRKTAEEDVRRHSPSANAHACVELKAEVARKGDEEAAASKTAETNAQAYAELKVLEARKRAEKDAELKVQSEKRRAEEAAARKAALAKAQAEAELKVLETRKRAQEDAARKAALAKAQADAERKAEVARRRADEEAEALRQAAKAEARANAELKAEVATRRADEEAEALRQAAEANARADAELKAEVARRRADEEAEALRQAAEAKARADAEFKAEVARRRAVEQEAKANVELTCKVAKRRTDEEVEASRPAAEANAPADAEFKAEVARRRADEEAEASRPAAEAKAPADAELKAEVVRARTDEEAESSRQTVVKAQGDAKFLPGAGQKAKVTSAPIGASWKPTLWQGDPRPVYIVPREWPETQAKPSAETALDEASSLAASPKRAIASREQIQAGAQSKLPIGASARSIGAAAAPRETRETREARSSSRAPTQRRALGVARRPGAIGSAPGPQRPCL
eukprot:TRINITY_DN2783_c0_g1_i2.p1 TRINITY_DN2783_c0_g1~~TRINITY_DN2783_c0_g1_i2.p1  ORF type:complete len:756 (-),score=220.13 TRINITY_DN2783_c0_g1_i2:10-2277(-)